MDASLPWPCFHAFMLSCFQKRLFFVSIRCRLCFRPRQRDDDIAPVEFCMFSLLSLTKIRKIGGTFFSRVEKVVDADLAQCAFFLMNMCCIFSENTETTLLKYSSFFFLPSFLFCFLLSLNRTFSPSAQHRTANSTPKSNYDT